MTFNNSKYLGEKGKNDANLGDMVLVDVTPLSLGLETKYGEMSKIIEKNTIVQKGRGWGDSK